MSGLRSWFLILSSLFLPLSAEQNEKTQIDGNQESASQDEPSDFEKLSKALQEKNLAAFQSLLREGANPLAHNDYGEYMLYTLLGLADIDFLKVALSEMTEEQFAEARELTVDTAGNLPIHIAFFSNGATLDAQEADKQIAFFDYMMEMKFFPESNEKKAICLLFAAMGSFPVEGQRDILALIPEDARRPGIFRGFASSDELNKFADNTEGVASLLLQQCTLDFWGVEPPTRAVQNSAKFWLAQGADPVFGLQNALKQGPIDLFETLWAEVPEVKKELLLGRDCPSQLNLAAAAMQHKEATDRLAYLFKMGLDPLQKMEQGLNLLQYAVANARLEAVKAIWDKIPSDVRQATLENDMPIEGKSLLRWALENRAYYSGFGVGSEFAEKSEHAPGNPPSTKGELILFLVDHGVKAAEIDDFRLAYSQDSPEVWYPVFSLLTEQQRQMYYTTDASAQIIHAALMRGTLDTFKTLYNSLQEDVRAYLLSSRQNLWLQAAAYNQSEADSLLTYLFSLGLRPKAEDLSAIASYTSMKVFERLWVMLSPEEMKDALRGSVTTAPLLYQAISNTSGQDEDACSIIKFVLKLPSDIQPIQDGRSLVDLVTTATMRGTSKMLETIWSLVPPEIQKSALEQLSPQDLATVAKFVNSRDSDISSFWLKRMANFERDSAQDESVSNKK